MNRLTDQQYIAVGEIIHYLAILINIILTSSALLLVNKPNASAYYDPWWTWYGFCVVDTLPTELLCFLSLTASAIGQFILCNRLQSGIIDVDPLLISRLKSGVFLMPHMVLDISSCIWWEVIQEHTSRSISCCKYLHAQYVLDRNTTQHSKPQNYPRHTNVSSSTCHPIHARCSSKPSIYIQSSGYTVSG